jgi:hypothetical protein
MTLESPLHVKRNPIRPMSSAKHTTTNSIGPSIIGSPFHASEMVNDANVFR